MTLVTFISPHVKSLLLEISGQKFDWVKETIVSISDKKDLHALRAEFPGVRSILVPWQKLEPTPPPTYWPLECAWAAVSSSNTEWVCFLDSINAVKALANIDMKTILSNKTGLLSHTMDGASFFRRSVFHCKQFRNYGAGASIQSTILASLPASAKGIISTPKSQAGLSVVMPYCSLEKDLIENVVQSLDGVCDELVLVYMTHFFDGSEDTEARVMASNLKSKYSFIKTVCLAWNPGAPHQGYWPITMRREGFLQTTREWVMLVDSDEVLRDRNQFKQWFAHIQDKATPSYKLANYWYFLSPKRRARTIEDSIVIGRRSVFFLAGFDNYREERGAFVTPQTERQTMGLDQKPMFDHFSWVRSRDNLLKKVNSWGHREDRDWAPLVTKAFDSGDLFTTPDFVHNYEYDIVE